MLSDAWLFTCDDISSPAVSNAVDTLLGRCQDIRGESADHDGIRILKFAVTKAWNPTQERVNSLMVRQHGRGVLHLSQSVFPDDCASIIPDCKWTPIPSTSLATTYAKMFKDDSTYRSYILRLDAQPRAEGMNRGPAHELQPLYSTMMMTDMESVCSGSSSCSFNTPSDVTQDGTLDLGDAGDNNDNTMQESAPQEIVHSAYSSSKQQFWRHRGQLLYSRILSNKEDAQRLLDTERSQQEQIPNCYYASTRPLEYRFYNLQLVMLRMDVQSLMAAFVSSFSFANPTGVWHYHTPVDETVCSLFPSLDDSPSGPSDSGRTNYTSLLNQLQIDASNSSDLFDRLCSRGDLFQPFCKIWRTMRNQSYKPGTKSTSPSSAASMTATASNTSSPCWSATSNDVAVSSNAESFGTVCKLLDNNQDVWFRHSLSKPWWITGALSRCMMELADVVSRGNVHIPAALRNTILRQQYDTLPDGAHYADAFLHKANAFRSSNVWVRTNHHLMTTCFLLCNLPDIKICRDYESISCDWLAQSIFKLAHLREQLTTDDSSDVKSILFQLQTPANMGFVLLKLWQISMTLPVVIARLFNLTEADDSSMLLWANLTQNAAKECIFHPNLTAGQNPKSSNSKVTRHEWLPQHVDTSLTLKTVHWLNCLSHFSVQLVVHLLFSNCAEWHDMEQKYEGDSSAYLVPPACTDNNLNKIHLMLATTTNECLAKIECIIDDKVERL